MPASKKLEPRFKTIQKLKVEYAPVGITQYESTRTGMRIAVVDRAGPKVDGEFALATEINDDSGSPHTLEHLVFMGSKTYKYTGLLDRLSSRAFSTTNAGTATDYTSYSLKTAGWEGFAQILPVYLEHLIVPTLTDAGCYTEVHHIDGAGNDAGVVYSEMQARENTSGDLMELQRRRLLYPEGNGFRSETGGTTPELRRLTADRIRAYHKEMYQPKNLRVIITGEIDHDELLQILDDFESTIVDDVPTLDAPFRRPWVDSKQTSKLTETKIDTITFPEEDESMGEVTIGYLGPSCDDSVANAALSVLMTYLANSPISVLENTLVEREQLCSAVYFEIETRPDVVTWFDLTSVETERLQEVYQRFLGVMKETVNKPLDMTYLHDCLKRERRRITEQAENSEDFFTQPIIEDHCFSARDGRFLKDLENLNELDEIAKWSEDQWLSFIKQYFVECHHVCVLGVPSAEMQKRLTEEEQARVKAQQDKLGEQGLKQLAEKLEEAKAENGKTIPDSMLEQFPQPSADSVNFIETGTARSGAARKMGPGDKEAQAIIDRSDDGSSTFIHFEHIPSNFVRIRLYFGTAGLPDELRPILNLYMTNFFTTPVLLDGKRIEFEDLVSDLEKLTTSYWLDTSTGGRQQMLGLSLVTEPETYEKAISRIRTVFFDAIHDPVRLHASLTKLLADLPMEKRAGDSMAWAVNSMIHSNRSANRRATSTLTKGLYLKRLRKLLKNDEKVVIEKLTKLCSALHRPENFRVYVAADLNKLQNPVSAWSALTQGLDTSKPLEPLDDSSKTISDVSKNPGSAAYVVPIPAIDSSYCLLTSKGPSTYSDPDLPALMVAIAYLRAVEGPLWVAIRGTGLAYGASIRRTTELGKIHFWIDRSPDCYRAFIAGKAEIEGYANGTKELKKLAIESAVGEIVYEMAEEAPTMGAAADESFWSQVLRGVSKTWSKEMLKKIQGVSVEEVRESIGKWLLPLFDAQKANLVVTCASGMKEKMEENFASVEFKVQVQELSYFEDDYGLEAPEGEDDDDEDDEDEEDEDGSDEDEEMEE
ncbi:Putative peptidase M16, metalloenzyme, LuxS/M16 peptidase [Septoria linicola]|uniref:Peptidase M16, metalloenzyme, LuxS/M16 peptidase n=1 Tax=Septoria linicola TaxID=215465 RepID=A0A9Q9EPN6_9PEZI|nr:Putative peptidase M16, metalloenzyme, LuxS/M16 peptidase [Septoria linicola]